jgi:hypothetical protein
VFDLILYDSENNPDLFIWNGPINEDDIVNWFEDRSLDVPDDFIKFLSATGGGNIFESEEILSPFGDPQFGNDLESTNDWFINNGLPEDMLIFNTGAYLSALRLSDQKYLLLDSIDYTIESEYNSFDDCYSKSVRAGFADRYNIQL